MKPPSPFERLPEQDPSPHPQVPWENVPKKGALDEPEKTEKKKKPKLNKNEQDEKAEKPAPNKNKKKPASEEKKPETEPQRQEKPAETMEEKEAKRAQLVEQSAAYAKHFEENPLPRDPAVLARLLVAQQILAVHEQLGHPPDDTPVDTAQLQTALDYMGELDSKLQDPSIEATPEIEEAYEEIIQLAHETLQQEENLDDIVSTVAADTQPDSSDSPTAPTTTTPADNRQSKKPTPRKPQPTPPASTVRSAAAAGLIVAIANLGRRKKQPEQQPQQPEDRASLAEITDRVPPSPYAAESAPTQDTTKRDAPPLPHSYRETLAPRPMPEHAQSNQPERRASPRETSPAILAATAIATAAAVSSGRAERATNSPSPLAETSQPTLAYEQPRTEAETLATPRSTDTRKIEHMPLDTLLHMAETVPVGHGRYLRRAYETGQIDKDGLIKILKSHSKGRDFLVEYRQQETRVRNLRAQSPEFLAAAAATTQANDLSDQLPSQSPTEDSTEKAPEPSASSTPSAQTQPLPLLPSLAQAAHNKPRTAWRLVALTLATIGIITLLGVVVFGLYSSFSS